MSLSAAEQYLLELINRARLDPQAEAQRYGLDLNAGLAPGKIGTQALQVLAPNDRLEAAAVAHSDWMLAANTFSHTGAGASHADDRMMAAGYEFTGTWSWRENLAWIGTTGKVDLAAAVESHHEGLYRSAGHRTNTFCETVREIGIGQQEGSFTYNGVTYRSSMLTEKFALSGAEVFVTGVAYHDTDANDFYSIGEADRGIWLAIDGQAGAVVAQAGGYGLSGAARDDTRVIVGETGPGGGRIAWLDMDLGDGNAKLDVVTTARGGYRIDVSVDTTLAAGIADGRLLGSAALDLTGSNAANRLDGNRGDNLLDGRGGDDWLDGFAGDDWLDGGDGHDMIFGGAGHDILAGRFGADQLYGGDGHDRLWGGNGPDVLEGGAGNDRMEGGNGHDTFIFSGHHDIIADFQDDIDTIWLRDKVWGRTPMSIDDILAMGHIENGNAVIDFAGNHSLTIWGVTDLAALANDLAIV